MTRCPKLLAIAFSAAATAAGAGVRDDIEALQGGQAELRARLDRIEAVLGSQALMDMARTLQRVQEELRALRGELETQAHALEELRRRQRELYLDLDRRLNELALSRAPAAAPSPAPVGDAPAAPAAPAASAPAAADEEAQRRAYTDAFALLREGRHEEAIAAFQRFLERYPQGPYSDNAWYWLGEAYYARRRFDEAAAAFRKVIDAFPDSNKLADARLKLGFTYYEMGHWEEARRALDAVRRQHPNSAAAALAEKRLARMSEEGH
ncbi:MAG: hypothetical protein KatS3mg121_0345 [Gammaproteobacteria bacterium]|nr:MAG: hypothetical protein KatS3mg121_0345 [Gammaproteobacteria bacterium]